MNLPHAICSVVIPCYNGEKELAGAVASIRAQSFQDYHLVLVDDGSTDGTLNLMRQLAEGDSKMTVVALGENRGRAAARNRGAEATRGPYLSFLDHDDAYHQGFLSTTSSILDNNPELDAIKVELNISIDIGPIRSRRVSESSATTMLMRRGAFEFVGGWPESPIFRTHVGGGEDIALMAMLRYCFKIGNIDQKLYDYRYRPGNNLDRFLARTREENGELIFTQAAMGEDLEPVREVERLLGKLRDRIRHCIRAAGNGNLGQL